MKLTDEQLRTLGMHVEYYAQQIFEEAGIASDFCVQHWDHDYVIFGGVNRVRWGVISGFTIADTTNERLKEVVRSYQPWKNY